MPTEPKPEPKPESLPPPFTVQRLDHVVLRVADLDRSVTFYRQVLGCVVDRRNDAIGLVHVRAGASMIDLVDIQGTLGRPGGAAAAADTGRNMDHVCLRIEPFDAAAVRAHLARHAVPHGSSVKLQYGAEGTGPSIYVQDPDGNTIELKGPAHAPVTGDPPR